MLVMLALQVANRAGGRPAVTRLACKTCRRSQGEPAVGICLLHVGHVGYDFAWSIRATVKDEFHVQSSLQKDATWTNQRKDLACCGRGHV